jgi:hypothetical protein
MATAKKHRQHHVWKSYLREWATDETLFCLQDSCIRPANIHDVAVQRHFYKLNALTVDDIEHIRKNWIEPFPHSRRVNENYLTMFSMWANIRQTLPEAAATNQDFVNFLDEQIINAEEDWHSGLESSVQPLIDAARHRDISFYKNDADCMLFLQFLSVQYFRTSGMKKRIIESYKTHDLSRCWNVLGHILATNVGSSLYLDRKRISLVLLENHTGVPFITSDQPAINLLSSAQPGKGPEHLALYYPISPNLALLLDDPDKSCGLSASPLSSEQVTSLNVTIASKSYRQTFANTADVLRTLIMP